MSLNVPDVGENIVVGCLVNKQTPQDLVLRLYKNNITPSDTDVAGTYTEAAFTGYAAITLTGASWSAPASGVTSYAQQTFTASGAAAESIYGYFLTQASSGILVWSERDAAAPTNIAVTGDNIKITPTIGAN
jgi:hypothetical protein